MLARAFPSSSCASCTLAGVGDSGFPRVASSALRLGTCALLHALASHAKRAVGTAEEWSAPPVWWPWG
eukprot:9744190-Alexandrium_andersonii.AAC.1